MYLVQSENSHKVRILVTKRLFVQSEFVQSEGRTKRGIAVYAPFVFFQHDPPKKLYFVQIPKLVSQIPIKPSVITLQTKIFRPLQYNGML